MRTAIGRVGLGLLLCGLPGLAAAQDPSPQPAPATLAYLEGRVDLEHEGLSDAATPSTLLLDGDRLRTRDGRAEVVFADGSLLHIDRDTDVEWLGASRIRLLEGRMALRLSAAANAYAVDTAPGAVTLDPRGEYSLALVSARSELALSVVRGVGELASATERVVVRGGETLLVDGAGRPTLRQYNSARFDDFTRWAYERANGGAQGASAQYLPPELRAYGWSFDRYGRWDYAPQHGYVWYPTVAVGWRPYWQGGWRHTRYGWTWFGLDPWAGPTHHFGRWGFANSAWFWIPNRVWGPAWVSWAYGPDVVSWSPLGWNGQPVFGFWNRPGRPYYDPWRAWTVIPRRHFGQRGPVQSWSIDGRRLPETSRRAFVTQAVAPPAPIGYHARGDYAVPRGSFSVAGPSPRQDRAVPRPSAPSWSTPGTLLPTQSWSTPVPGGVRRDRAPEMREVAPPMPRVTDPRPRSEYAVPRRAPDGSFRQEDAESFRGRNRATRPEPPASSGASGGQSWQRPSDPSRGGARQEGAVQRSRGGEDRAAAPPPQSRPSNSGGESRGTSRGASRRPPS